MRWLRLLRPAALIAAMTKPRTCYFSPFTITISVGLARSRSERASSSTSDEFGGLVLEQRRIALKLRVLGLELRQLLGQRFDAGVNLTVRDKPMRAAHGFAGHITDEAQQHQE